MKTAVAKVHVKKTALFPEKHAGKKDHPEAGIVHSHIRAPGKSAPAAPTPSKVIEGVTAGLPIDELDALQASLGIPIDELARKLGISKATLHRRKLEGRLGRNESDRVVRFARLMGKAVEVFETEANARSWLSSPQFGLGGAAPLDYAETEVGAREVEDLLGRIEHGVYS